LGEAIDGIDVGIHIAESLLDGSVNIVRGEILERRQRALIRLSGKPRGQMFASVK